jgi:hypothetical protein
MEVPTYKPFHPRFAAKPGVMVLLQVAWKISDVKSKNRRSFRIPPVKVIEQAWINAAWDGTE